MKRIDLFKVYRTAMEYINANYDLNSVNLVDTSVDASQITACYDCPNLDYGGEYNAIRIEDTESGEELETIAYDESGQSVYLLTLSGLMYNTYDNLYDANEAFERLCDYIESDSEVSHFVALYCDNKQIRYQNVN